MKHKFAITGLAIGCSAAINAAATGKDSPDTGCTHKPNIVFILADDLGYGDIGCYGQEKFSTPNIDSLAARGMRFTRFYSGTTVSAPSRACLLTGLHSGHAPVRGNIETPPEGQYPLPPGRNIFRIFQEHGYITGAFGKWGLGAPGSTGEPARQGIDEFFGYNCQLLAHNYYPDHLWENGRKIVLENNSDGQYGTYAQDMIHEKALEFIDNNSDSTFFLFLPYVLPHAELLVPEDSIIAMFRGMYPETPYRGCDSGPAFRKGGYCSQPEPRATFAAMVYRLDTYVGQIVERLKANGIYGNTIIIFASDNGPHMEGGADPEFFNSNGIYRGLKRDLYEGGIRVPFIAAWEGRIRPGSESSHPAAFWDIMPTFLEILEENGNKPGKAVKPLCHDGISILPELTGKGKQRKHGFFYFEFQEEGGKQAVIAGDMKLIRLNVSGGDNQIWELYDLKDDPSETANLLETRHPDKKYRKAASKLRRIMQREHESNPAWPLLQHEHFPPATDQTAF